MLFVDILRCAGSSYYVGKTNDLLARLGEHRAGVGLMAPEFDAPSCSSTPRSMRRSALRRSVETLIANQERSIDRSKHQEAQETVNA